MEINGSFRFSEVGVGGRDNRHELKTKATMAEFSKLDDTA